MATADWVEADEWELINDDGFVYKRKKRPHVDPPTSAPPPPDPAAEDKNRRERKRNALTKLKERYQKEIDNWELLSNTMKDMSEKTPNQQQQKHEHATPFDEAIGSDFSPVQSSDSTRRQLVDDLIAQAEAQEAIIRDVSNLCDAAEALCNAQEERARQPFLDLPIWAPSPRELITSLCEE